MTILELYMDYTNNGPTNLKSIINIYEKNSDLIENLDVDANIEIYNAVMRLTADYAHKLKIKESYSKALPYLNKAITLFENYDGFDKTKMNEVEYYKILRFDRGVSNYYTNQFTESENDFTWLIDSYPDNEIFKNWITAIRSRKYDSFIKILWYLIAASVLLGTFINKENHKQLYNIVLCSGVTALFVAIIFEAIRHINKKKLKKIYS